MSERPGTSPNAPPPPAPSYRTDALADLLRLNWFIRLRWLFVGVAFAVLAVERFALPNTTRPWQLLVVVLSVAVVNLAWTLVAHVLRTQVATGDSSPDAQRAGTVFANAQVAADLLLLTAILHYTGGAENPMSVFYLFHVAISGLLLRPRHAFLQAGWATLLYAALTVAELQHWLAHFVLLPSVGVLGVYQQPAFVLLLVLVNACAVFGTLYFTSRIARVVDAHEAQLIRTNAALEKSRHAIEDLQRRRARFMQTAAHQLKSPLAIVQTLANLVRDRIVSDPPAVQATCEKISRRAAEGITQVTELLTLARVQDADPARVRSSRVDVRAALQDLYGRYRPLAEEKQLDLTLWLPDAEDLHANVDPQDFRDCVSNLIENAIKYTPAPGRVRLAATRHAAAGGHASVAIHVSDTGLGLDPTLLRSAGRLLGDDPIFEAFRRGPNVVAAGIPGTGLGLSIVREVVEQAGGHIWVMSRPGAGSAFTVTFPASDASADEVLVRDTRATRVVLELPAEAAATTHAPHDPKS
jgi:signal transduction histidine kinase